MDALFFARWTEREAIGPLARRALGVIIRRLATGEGALPVAGLLPDHPPAEVADALAELDQRDLILLEAGPGRLPDPLSTRRHAFPPEHAPRWPRAAACAAATVPETFKVAAEVCGRRLPRLAGL